MDLILSVLDTLVFDRAYSAAFPLSSKLGGSSIHTGSHNVTMALFSPRPETDGVVMEYTGLAPSEYAGMSYIGRDDIRRQFFSLFLIVWLFGVILYFVSGTLSYVFVFDKDTFKHPKFLKNQIRQEIATSMKSMPFMSLLTAPFFLAEVQGYSKLYLFPSEYGQFYMWFQFPLFICFTDGLIYLIHRGLHHPSIYKSMHKSHHKWIMPTPFASHAFHPVDGWAQSLPYHFFPFIFPLQKLAYIALFMFINIWTVLIHDGEYVANSPIINGAACHTMHHLYFNYNYGQFTTFWDRLGGSYRKPNIELFYKETKMSKEEWARQKKEMEETVKAVEGDDSFRVYGSDEVTVESKKGI